MKNKTILVTGASSGIGNAIATYFLEAGATVILVARTEESLFKLKEKYGDRAYVYPFDLSQTSQINNIFLYCKEQGLLLDAMVHAAGITMNCPVKTLYDDKVEYLTKVNYLSFVQLMRYFVQKKYSKEGASVVVMSSMAATLCEKGLSAYSASKAAVNAFVKSCSKESLGRGIRVNGIAPSYVETAMAKKAKKELGTLDIETKQSMGLIPLEQVVKLTKFLLSEDANYITGEIVEVSAGYEV